jgi:hypothetical protein
MRGGGAAGHSSRTRLLRSQPLPIVLALRQGCEQLGSIGGCGRIRTARAGQGRLAQGQEARSKKQAASSKQQAQAQQAHDSVRDQDRPTTRILTYL